MTLLNLMHDTAHEAGRIKRNTNLILENLSKEEFDLTKIENYIENILKANKNTIALLDKYYIYHKDDKKNLTEMVTKIYDVLQEHGTQIVEKV